MPRGFIQTVSILATLALSIAFLGYANKQSTPKDWPDIIKQLEPLHTPLRKPRPGDWLDKYPETGQTFQQYLRCNPETPQGKRNTIYILPIGEFTTPQQQILDLTREYMEIYFGIPVITQPTESTSIIPDEAQRTHDSWGDHQLLTTYILYNILKPRLPDDAAAMIAFTADDLWPGERWNFVFGQASLRERVGVWSIYRNGDPMQSDEMFTRCLRRTIKTAIHETGHMFTIKHCTAYECVMCGSNHREEADRRPLYLCPQCMAKICWAANLNPLERYKKLEAFCSKHKLLNEAAYFKAAIGQMEKPPIHIKLRAQFRKTGAMILQPASYTKNRCCKAALLIQS